ncbi:unnamed protein product, partial [Heterosigma akashiwo]
QAAQGGRKGRRRGGKGRLPGKDGQECGQAPTGGGGAGLLRAGLPVRDARLDARGPRGPRRPRRTTYGSWRHCHHAFTDFRPHSSGRLGGPPATAHAGPAGRRERHPRLPQLLRLIWPQGEGGGCGRTAPAVPVPSPDTAARERRAACQKGQMTSLSFRFCCP